MMLTKYVCNYCGAVAEAKTKEFVCPPKGWLTFEVKMNNAKREAVKGNIDEQQHACPECASKSIIAAATAIANSSEDCAFASIQIYY